MKKILMALVITMITMIATVSFGYQPPNAPANGWYVLDQAGKLSTEEVAKLNQKIEHLNKTTKNEFAILIVSDMGGDNIEDVAHATFNSWGVGKKDLDNGILIVIAIQERRSRIETGKGIGGEVPDLKANDIIGKHLTPHLKQGQFFAGLNETLDALSGNLDSRAQQPVAPPPKSTGCNVSAAGTSSDVFGSVLALILCSIFALYVWARMRERAITKRFKQSDYNITPTNSYTRPHELSVHESIARAKVTTTMVRPIKTVTADSVNNSEDRKREERAAYRQQLANESLERLRREREDKNRRKTAQAEENQRSNYHFTSSVDTSSSSSSIFDWGSSSSDSSSSDSGSGFGGGDSGGGGSSSDW